MPEPPPVVIPEPPPPVAVAEHRFRVMASDAHIVVVGGPPEAAEQAESRLRDLEQSWSRFLPSSDICRFNASGGGWIDVDRDTVALIETMQLANRITMGSYDPTLLCEVITLGYTASIDDPARVSVMVDMPSVGHRVGDIAVDRAARRV
jgi:thiamine biosynthesis lipoprotein